MADIASRPAFAPRVPLPHDRGGAAHRRARPGGGRALAIGSRKASVPAPFGPRSQRPASLTLARGDIYVLNPTHRHLARHHDGPGPSTPSPCSRPTGRSSRSAEPSHVTAGVPEDIVPVAADGSHPTVVTGSPIPGGPKGLEWAPNSQSILATAAGRRGDWRFDATAAQPPRTIATNAFAFDRPFQPPDGAGDPHRP